VKAIVGCECSARVRDALRRRGVDAWSCDLKPCEGDPRWHIQGDVLDHLDGWDLGIFHPDCTHLCNSGVRWLHERPARWDQMEQACLFFRRLWDYGPPMLCIENPVMHGHAKKLIGVQQTQTVQPWWFGDPERKATCLWLKNLPPLFKTNPVLPLGNSVHREPPGPNRKANRSRTFHGLAEAMADQWSPLLEGRAAA
jgi:hypothetical protein